MEKSIDIAVLVGSLRKASLNRMMANVLIAQASSPLKLETVEIGHQPEAYVGHANKLFGPNGTLINEDTRKFLSGFMQAFGVWIEADANSTGIGS
jgi:chromate reductase, NAD(P)H dehydrogenase (quinone)